MLFALLAGLAHAVPSACGALWGTLGNNLAYFNPATNTWVSAAPVGFAGNAISGYEGDGSLYFVSAVAPPQTMYKASFDNTTGGITVGQVSAAAISIPAGLTYTTNTGATATVAVTSVVGATFDRDTNNKRMFLYVTSGGNAPNLPVNGGGTSPLAAVGVLDPDFPTVVTWSVLHQTTATGTVTYPQIGGSGDIFADQQSGALWVATNTAGQNRMLQLSLNYTGLSISSAQVVGTATITGTSLPATIGSVAVDPASGLVYIASGPSLTWRLADHTSNPVLATRLSNTQGTTDAGNCVAPPDPPTVSKSFNPTATSTTPGLSTLTITIHNPNKVPIYTTANLTDAFPAGMVVSTTPSLSGTCFTDGTPLVTRPAASTITGVAGAASAVITAGAIIPGGSTSGGSCSFNVRVSTTVADLYLNTIPAGSLTTSAGSNVDAATATFQLQNAALPNPPEVTKSFSPVTSTSGIGTSTLTVVVYNPNTATNSFTAALVDTLPAGLGITTPSLLSIACFSNGVAVTRPTQTTATTTAGALTMANGSRIPGGASGGSCSFSVRVTSTTAGIYNNTIAAGALDTQSGSNADAATATFSLRASDFSVVKSQRIGDSGATTTASIDVASAATMSYVISIRNTAGVAGTRTFTDTLPQLVTPVLSITAVGVGGAACTTASSVVTARTNIRGTVTSAAVGGGCDITIVAKVSTTAVVTGATNSVGIYTVTGAFEADTSDNTSTVALTIKPGTVLTIAKTNGTTQLFTMSTTSYTITVANLGPAAADDAVVGDNAAVGLDCATITCSATSGASCPSPVQLFVSALQTTGLAIPSFPAASTVTFVLTCQVTATGL